MSRDEGFRVEPVSPDRSPTLEKTGVSRDETFGQCVNAFVAGDYACCVEQAWTLVEDAATLHTLQLLFIALQRLGRLEELQRIGPMVLASMNAQPWGQLLLRLTLGLVHPKDVWDQAADDLQRCQATFYGGAQLLTCGNFERARHVLQQCVGSKCDCLERYLAICELARLESTSEGAGTVDWEQHINQLCDEAIRLYQHGHFDEIVPIGNQAMNLARQHLSTNSRAFSSVMTKLFTLSWMPRPGPADPWLNEAVAACRRGLQGNHPDVALRLNSLAMNCEAEGDPVHAEALFKLALKAVATAQTEMNREFVSFLMNLGDLYMKSADYPRAERAFGQALEISQSVLGEEAFEYAASLHYLGRLYMEMADFRRAEHLLRRSWQMMSKLSGKDHPDTVACMVNWASVLMNIGDYEIPKRFFNRALEIEGAKPDKDARRYAQILHHLAVLYQNKGDWNRAEELYLQAMETRRAALGENHPHFAESLNTLALLYCFKGEYARAEPLFLQSLEIRCTAQGENHPKVGECLSLLGGMYVNMGDYGRAEPFLRQSLEVKRAALGESHPEFAVSLRYLGVLCAATNRPREAFGLLRQSVEISDCMVGQIFAFGGEHQRAAFLGQEQHSLELLLSLVWRFLGHLPEALCVALNAVLRRKGLRGEGEVMRRRAVLASSDSDSQSLLKELDKLDAKIARKALAGPGSESPDVHLHQLNKWLVERNYLDWGLAIRVAKLNLDQHLQLDVLGGAKLNVDQVLQLPDRRAVAQALPEGAVLVEFVSFVDFDFLVPAAEGRCKPARYLAFVLLADEPDKVAMVDLGEAAAIERLIDEFRASVAVEPQDRPSRDVLRLKSGPQPATSNQAGQDLRAVIFDKLVPAFQGQTRIFLAPDGALTRLPFEVLPGSDGLLLLEQYRISYVDSARDLLRFGVRPSGQTTGPLVVADPDFDLGATGISAASRHTTYHFRRLPDSREGGKQVADLLGVEPWLGGDALEGRLKRVRSPRVLHLATHGFFLQDQGNQRDAGAMDALAAQQGGGRFSGPLVQQNPLLRSGLALAGAQTWLEGGALPPEAEDGLLTAQDVQGLDLLGTDLVVLSACDTGLGAVQVGEGVFGLRRAFTVAGARTLVMSLWKVPDEQTRELMIDFYRRLLSGQGAADALRQAQLALKRTHPDPYFWGAFICQGDPATTLRATAPQSSTS